MRQIFLAAALLAPSIAYAQPAKPAEMALLPRDPLVIVLQQIQSIDALRPGLIPSFALQMVQVTAACLADNPVDGHVAPHTGPDQCPAVTAALAEQAKELADAKAQVKDLQTQLHAAQAKAPTSK